MLAIVSATFGPVPDTHYNDMKSSLEAVLLKMNEQEEGVGAGASDLRQLQCETAYIQKVLESSIKEIYDVGEAPSMEKAVEAYRSITLLSSYFVTFISLSFYVSSINPSVKLPL